MRTLQVFPGIHENLCPDSIDCYIETITCSIAQMSDTFESFCVDIWPMVLRNPTFCSLDFEPSLQNSICIEN